MRFATFVLLVVVLACLLVGGCTVPPASYRGEHVYPWKALGDPGYP